MLVDNPTTTLYSSVARVQRVFLIIDTDLSFSSSSLKVEYSHCIGFSSVFYIFHYLKIYYKTSKPKGQYPFSFIQ